MMAFVGWMLVVSLLGGLSVPALTFLLAFTGLVEPLQVSWRRHVIEIERWHARYYRTDTTTEERE